MLFLCSDEAAYITGEAMTLLTVNKMRGTINPLPISAPAFGDSRTKILEDLAIVTGATLITKTMGLDFEHVALEDLLARLPRRTHGGSTARGAVHV